MPPDEQEPVADAGPGSVKPAELVPGEFESKLQFQMDIEAARFEHLSRLQRMALYSLLLLFALGNAATISLYFLNGFGATDLTDVAMASLSAATIAEVGGLLTVVMTGIFRTG